MVELESKFNEYVKRFGEPVPVYVLSGLTDEQLARLIDDALKSGEPIVVDLMPGANY